MKNGHRPTVYAIWALSTFLFTCSHKVYSQTKPKHELGIVGFDFEYMGPDMESGSIASGLIYKRHLDSYSQRAFISHRSSYGLKDAFTKKLGSLETRYSTLQVGMEKRKAHNKLDMIYGVDAGYTFHQLNDFEYYYHKREILYSYKGQHHGLILTPFIAAQLHITPFMSIATALRWDTMLYLMNKYHIEVDQNDLIDTSSPKFRMEVRAQLLSLNFRF